MTLFILVRIVRSRLWRLGHALATRWHRRRMIAALAALDNRMLKDIGVPRCEIDYLVCNPLRRRGAELRTPPAARCSSP